MVPNDPVIEALARIGLFSACTKQELSTVARSCTAVEVDDGFVLTHQGLPGQECFVIANGNAQVVIDGHRVATVGPGDWVGETALLDNGPRTATVVATTPMRLWVMNRREFNSVLEASATITRKLLVTLAARLRNADTETAAGPTAPLPTSPGRADPNHTDRKQAPAPIANQPTAQRSRGQVAAR
jgi:CRP-like cAMP-binding protein